MRVLGLDTATWTASIGLIDANGVLAERSLAVARSHAAALLPLIEETLAAARLDLRQIELIAVSIGPGSFTGLRIGLSTAKGLSLATGIPVVGVPTLEALARAAGPRAGLVCPVLDARKGEVYGAAFRWRGADLEPVVEVSVLAPARLAARLATPCTLIGDAVEPYADVWHSCLGDGVELVPLSEVSPRGAVVATLGAARWRVDQIDDLARIEPIYVRKSEAELQREARR